MDLDIHGRTALLCGASRGLGYASAARLAEAGVNLVLAARNETELARARQTLSERYPVTVRSLVADVTADAGIETVLAACPDPDILILSGAWPAAELRSGDASRAQWQAALQAMLLSQTTLIGAVAKGMAARRFGRIVAVTSRLIKEPEWELALPSVARLGLTGYVKALSREVAPHNVTVNTLLPGIFATETQLAHTQRLVRESAGTVDDVERERVALTPAARFGLPDEFGALCAFLCSRHAGFITGQAIVVDGGAHAGVW